MSIDLRQLLQPGDHIVLGQACGEPTTLVEALIAQGADIPGLKAFIATSFSGLFTPESAASFRLSSMGAIGALRSMTKAHALDVIPVQRLRRQSRVRLEGAGRVGLGHPRRADTNLRALPRVGRQTLHTWPGLSRLATVPRPHHSRAASSS